MFVGSSGIKTYRAPDSPLNEEVKGVHLRVL